MLQSGSSVAQLECCCRTAYSFFTGPYRRDGRDTAPSNTIFDESLRQQNSAWGLRDLEAVVALAEASGFAPPLIEEMPANNISLIFRLLTGDRLCQPQSFRGLPLKAR
jgi:hypothetical protein